MLKISDGREWWEELAGDFQMKTLWTPILGTLPRKNAPLGHLPPDSHS